MTFPEFEYFLLDFSHFSRNFSINKKSRKSLLHKAFRDFDFRQILEIVFVCVVRLIFLSKRKDRIDMPRGFMDNLEGEVSDEKIHECALGKDILSADLYCEDALLPNI